MSVFTALTWILTPLFIARFGPVGFPLAHVIVSSSTLLVTYKAWRETRFRFFAATSRFLLAAIAMGAGVLFVQRFVNIPLPYLVVLSVVSGGVFYFLFLKGFFNTNLITEVKSFAKKR